MDNIGNHDRIFEILYSEKNEIRWQGIIYSLVKSEQMDPWNIDISTLTKKYVEKIKELKKHDFRISGKVLLAAAILLKIKSDRLVGEDFEELDKLLASIQGQQEEETGIFDESDVIMEDEEIPPLIPRMPQPRKRKVSIYDLVKALQQALEVKKRRVWRSEPPTDIRVPKRPREITEIIKEIYNAIKIFFKSGNNKLTFSKLLHSESKMDKVNTFIPLLHLSQQNKVELIQEEPFGEIEIIPKELSIK